MATIASKRRPATAAKPSEASHSTANPRRSPFARARVERGLRALERRHRQAGALVGQRQRDGAAARAPVQDRPARGQQPERPLHQQLGLGPRHQHLGADRDPQPPEGALAGQVGDRLAAAAAGDQLPGAVALGRGQRPLRARVEVDALDAEGVGQQQLGVEPRGRRAALAQVGRAAAQHVAHGEELGRAGQRRALCQDERRERAEQEAVHRVGHLAQRGRLGEGLALDVHEADVELGRLRVHRLDGALHGGVARLAPDAQPDGHLVAAQHLQALVVDLQDAARQQLADHLGVLDVPDADDRDVLDPELADLVALHRLLDQPHHALEPLAVAEAGHRARGDLGGPQHELGPVRAREGRAAVGVVLQPPQPVAVADRREEERDVVARHVHGVVPDGQAEELDAQEVRVGPHDDTSAGACSSSRRRRSSAARASVSASSRPSSTCSRSGTLRPTRWSVTRFWGKL